jgi:acetyl esterase/lipase
MHKLISILLISCVSSITASAQTLAPVDTSFTTYSAFQKNIKHYPQIKIANTTLNKNVNADRNVNYCTAGNFALNADVFYPKTKKKKPAVIIIHGGGWRSGDRSMEIPIAQELANKGYVAVCVDYRLSTEALYPAAINDLKAAVKWIKANAVKYHIDTNKIAVMGCSAGGQLAALTGTTNNDMSFEGNDCITTTNSTVQAIIDIDGTLAFIHPESGEGADKPGKPSAATLWLGATATENPALWQSVAPLNHVSSVTPPVLFINSGIDRMHAGRNDMIKQLDTFQIYSEVHTFKDAPHPFWLFEPWFQPMVDFIDKFLKKIF